MVITPKNTPSNGLTWELEHDDDISHAYAFIRKKQARVTVGWNVITGRSDNSKKPKEGYCAWIYIHSLTLDEVFVLNFLIWSPLMM